MEEIIKKCLPAYTVDEKIGKGVYGNVYRLHDAFKQRAVKVVPITAERSLGYATAEKLDSRVSQDFHAVREYYETIKGPGVVEVYDFFMVDKQADRSSARAYLVILMQLCQSNLLDYIIDHHPLPVAEALSLMSSLAAVLNRLSIETDGIFLLTDLKPSNLLINKSKEVLIGDLGGLKRLGSDSTLAGAQFSPNWSSPEFILQGARPNVPAVIFSFGMVSYFILEGHLPYADEDFSGRTRRIKSDGITFSRRDLPDHVRYVVEQCVQFNANRRPKDFSEIREVLGDTRVPEKTPGGRVSGGRPGGRPRIGNRESGRSRISRPPNKDPYRPGEQWREPVAGIEFVWIPGRPAALAGDAMTGFWMGRTPVTQGQWQQVMGANPSHFALGSSYPVEGVAWGNALDFARRLADLNQSRYVFCLPTESQWVYAAQWESGPAPGIGGGAVDRFAWHSGNSGLTTQPVGQKASTGLGLYDLFGNVMEWCGEGSAEEIKQTYGRHGSVYADVGQKQAGRGGSWKSSPEECGPGFRILFPRQLGYSNLGFRIIRPG